MDDLVVCMNYLCTTRKVVNCEEHVNYDGRKNSANRIYQMDLKRIFSGRVIGLIAFIVVVLFLGAVGNMSLEGLADKESTDKKPSDKNAAANPITAISSMLGVDTSSASSDSANKNKPVAQSK